jgi:SPOR domain
MRGKAKSGSTRLVLIGVAGMLLAGCGLLPPLGGSGDKGTRTDPDAADHAAAVQPTPAGRFEEPGELDRLVDAKPINLAAVKPMAAAGSPALAKSPTEVSTGRGRFRIQVGAENDIDAAQGKKAEYERKLGGTVDVVFDAPYYKLRWGYFETKQDADDKILEISEFNIQGFVVKQ